MPCTELHTFGEGADGHGAEAALMTQGQDAFEAWRDSFSSPWWEGADPRIVTRHAWNAAATHAHIHVRELVAGLVGEMQELIWAGNKLPSHWTDTWPLAVRDAEAALARAQVWLGTQG